MGSKGSPRSIATLLQRVGRSGHAIAGLPKGRLFPLSRDDLIECSALLEAARQGELDRLTVPPGAIDVLAQQIVAIVAAEDYDEDRLFDLVRGAHPYRVLTRSEFAAVVRLLSEGYSGRWGRRAASATPRGGSSASSKAWCACFTGNNGPPNREQILGSAPRWR